MEIPNKVLTFSQDEDDYIITDKMNLTFENVDWLKDKGWTVNVRRKTISPYLPIGVLSRMSPGWDTPDKQLDSETLKDFKKLG